MLRKTCEKIATFRRVYNKAIFQGLRSNRQMYRGSLSRLSNSARNRPHTILLVLIFSKTETLHRVFNKVFRGIQHSRICNNITSHNVRHHQAQDPIIVQ